MNGGKIEGQAGDFFSVPRTAFEVRLAYFSLWKLINHGLIPQPRSIGDRLVYHRDEFRAIREGAHKHGFLRDEAEVTTTTSSY